MRFVHRHRQGEELHSGQSPADSVGQGTQLSAEDVRGNTIHELCHTRAMNHSRDFWRLVAEKEPEGRRVDRELNKAWQYVPGWMSYEVE